MSEGAVTAVVFDWGGTLTPWHPIDPLHAWSAYARGRGDQHDPDQLAARLSSAEHRAWLAARDLQASATLAQLITDAGVTASGEAHEAGLTAYQEAWEPHTWTDPHAAGLLAALKRRGIRIGVLSNTLWTREYHESVFRRDGLHDLIDTAIYSSEIRYTKPHPAAFRAVLDALAVDDPGTAMYVGDRRYDDIFGAARAGMRTVLVPHSDIPAEQLGEQLGDPDTTVDTLAGVLEIVGRWRGSHRMPLIRRVGRAGHLGIA